MGKQNQQRRRAKAKARRTVRKGDQRGHGHELRSEPPSAAGSDDGSGMSVALQVNDLVGRALDDLEEGRGHGVVVERLANHCRHRDGRRAVVSTVVPALRDGVTSAWEKGWEPADLHRLAGRNATAAAQSLLLDTIADELRGYAASTIDPRWDGQLEDLGAHVWWPPDRTPVDARADVEGWAAVTAAAVTALHLLLTLPKLERLGPRPGTARAAPEPATAHLDQRVLAKVRALLAKAESTTFEAEAEAFTAGAQSLMARYSIDAALLAAQDDAGAVGGERPQGRRIGVDKPYEEPKAMLLAAVADANRCRCVWSRALGFSTVVGFATDVDAVETLFTSLLLQGTRAMTHEGTRRDASGRSRTRGFRRSFLAAYAGRIGERLREVTRDETEKATHDTETSGRELVPILAARDQAVDDAVAELFPDHVHHRMSAGSDPEGWSSGRQAADRASLGVGPPVETGPSGNSGYPARR